MGFVFARRGIIPEACSSWFLPRVVGISQAMEWVATGRVFSAQEALDGGLVRSVHPPGELLDAARRAGPGDRRQRRTRLGRAGPPADVEDARRRAPDARPPGRLARDARPRPVGGRASRASPRSSRSARRASPTASAPDSRTSCPGGRSPTSPERPSTSRPAAPARATARRRTGRPARATRSSTCAGVKTSRAGSPLSSAAATSSHSSGVETVGALDGAQRVDAHGRLALVVLAPVDQHLAGAPGLGHARHHQLRLALLEQLGDRAGEGLGLLVARRRGGSAAHTPAGPSSRTSWRSSAARGARTSRAASAPPGSTR